MSVTRLNQQRLDFYVGVLDDLLQIVDKLENCGGPPRQTNDIPVIAKIEATGFNVEIGMEYFIYINMYGVPLDGVFDETILQKIRDGLPLPPTTGCGKCHKVVCCCAATSCNTDTSCSTIDPSGCESHNDSGCGGVCCTCHQVVCCCSTSCGTGCDGTGTDGTGTDGTGTDGIANDGTGTDGTGTDGTGTDGTGTGTSIDTTTRVDTDTAGGGDLGIVILE